MLFGLASVLYNSKTLADSVVLKNGTSAAHTGATFAELFSIIGLSVSMAVVCFIIYYIASHSLREFKRETKPN